MATTRLPSIGNCPDDINEAISSLIFASARCGNLPELLHIRKLLTERYGDRFETTALELLPGNLVNFQIIENLSIKNVPDEVKYKLVEEITTSVRQNGPLALEFASEKYQQATNSNANHAVPATGTQQTAFSPNRIHFDHPGVDTDPSMIIDADDAESYSTVKYLPEEIIYLDDIAEFQSPLNSAENGTDQRVFVFKSSVVVSVEENPPITYQFSDLSIEHSEHSKNETKVPRRSRKRWISSDIDCSGYRKTSAGHQNHLFVRRIGDLGICRDDYTRAISMPCKRSTKCVDENGVMRSNSLPVEPSPPHVHPKLPDYDQLAAMFKALKKEHLQNHK
ncbi:hypothetical protein L6452_19382 [Arctium lappa]|uniref:Uncharacterized protein n=1 Tax=Arctium lappa TaxID=4217 RepID=A0ACB9B9A2_ARCLA|nr:hypothetical protein L6452_19382 [Arctium lappa]